MWFLRKLSSSASGVLGVMTVYGFVVGERLNLVIQDAIVSVGLTSPASHFFFSVATSI